MFAENGCTRRRVERMVEGTLPDELHKLVWIYIRASLCRRAKCVSRSWRRLHAELIQYVCQSKLSQIEKKWKQDVLQKQNELNLGWIDDYDYRRWCESGFKAKFDARKTVFHECEEARHTGERMRAIILDAECL